MEMNDGMKIVEFDKYCKTCMHEKVDEEDEPCYTCLDNPVNQYSHKPVKWEEKLKPVRTNSKPVEEV